MSVTQQGQEGKVNPAVEGKAKLPKAVFPSAIPFLNLNYYEKVLLAFWVGLPYQLRKDSSSAEAP